jgi:L-seryl-tRNA(Ser) seleniumtransferase
MKTSPPVKSSGQSELYRKLPSIDELLRETEVAALAAREGRALVVDAARQALEMIRREIAAGRVDETSLASRMAGLPRSVTLGVQRSLQPSLQNVINATGVILHTNLGRAPLSTTAIEAIQATAAGYSNLEFDLMVGSRGKRDAHVERLFQRLFEPAGAGDVSTIVVNNNAAAVWLALNSLAAGGEVIVSRGELVEIGGSFRIPDVMAQSNGILREVGTTNRTRIADYERAITDRTRVLLRVHRSNFEITGFTEQPSLEELVALARSRSIPLVEDLGSGALFDLKSAGIHEESGVIDSLRAGVDVVTYSGDKLLGGPQAGMLSGRRELIAHMRSNSLFRALRADKLVYAALEATLLAYVRGDYDAVPVLRMMRLNKDAVRARVEELASRLAHIPHAKIELLDGESVIGGGAAPSAVLPTCLLGITSENLSADELLARLRASSPPIIARVEDDRVILDLRTVFPEQDATVAKACARALGPHFAG